MRFLYFNFILIIAITIVSATPSYMWYGTCSVEKYLSNGCTGVGEPDTPHEEADGFHTALQNRKTVINNVVRKQNRRDATATANAWKNMSAPMNYCDFVFFAGHGHGFGPVLGCWPEYLIDNQDDMRLGGYGYLKWVQGAACEWFVASQYTDPPVGEFARWDPAFKGVHVVQGHRADSFDHPYGEDASEDFWNRWYNQNQSIYSAWCNAQIYWIYTVTGRRGLQPAQMAHNSDYFYETFTEAENSLAPDGASIFGWATVGNPQYSYTHWEH